jgi:RHS repeat-associated protein
MTRSKIRNCLTVVIVMFATLGPLLVAGQPSQSASLVPHSLRNTELTSGSQTWAVQHDGFAITGISCPSASTCYAVGNVSQGVAFTKMTGSIWSTPTLIAGVTTLSSLSCPTAQSCFAVGMSSSPSVPVVEQSTNSGVAWVQLGMPSSMVTMNVISCSSATACAVGGSETVAGNTYGAFITLTTNGTSPSWGTPNQLAFRQTVGGLSCTSIGYCGAIVDGATFMYSINTGGSWTNGSIPPPSGRGNNYVSVSCANSGTSSTCVVAGYCPSGVGGCYSFSGGVFAGTSDSGTTWTSGGVGAGLSEVACGSATQCIALGIQAYGCGYGCTWYGPMATTITPVTGVSKTDTLPITDTTANASQLSAVACAAATCFIGGSSGIEQSIDGVTFTPVAFETPPLSKISCGSSLNCMGVTQTGGLVATNSGGALWFNLPPLQQGNCLTTTACDGARSVACSSGSKCIVSYDSITYSGGCGCSQVGIATSNLGLTWTQRSDASNALGCAEGTSTCEGIGLFPNGGWQTNVSTDGGYTYMSVAAAVTDGSTANAVSCGSSSMCLAVGSSPSIQLTTSSAGSWSSTAVNTGITGLILNAITCPTSTTCLAVGNSGAVVLLSIQGTTVTATNLTGLAGIPSGVLQAVSCDSAVTCSIFGATSGAQTANLGISGTTFSSIPAVPSQLTNITSSACGGVGSCLAVGYTSRGVVNGSVVLSTNGNYSPTFLPNPLVAALSYGGPDGSQPCFACALKTAGLSAQGFAAEPINTSDGDFYETVPITSIPGVGPNLSFSATYDAQVAQMEMTNGQNSPGPLGWGWSANSSMSLSGISGGGVITVNEEGGAQIFYSLTATGPGFAGATCTTSATLQCYTPIAADVTAVLEGLPSSGTYQFSRNNGRAIDTFNSSGQLTTITDANGHSEIFTYGVTTGANCSTSGTSCTVETDASGRNLYIVTTVATALVAKVIDPAGRTWNFAFDASKNLVSITSPRSGVESFGYDISSINPTMVHNMTSLVLPNGQAGGPSAGAGYAIAYQESFGSSTAPHGYVISQVDPAGLATTFSYSGQYASIASGASSTGTTTITQCTTLANCTAAPAVVEFQTQDEYLNGTLYAHVTGANTTHPETSSFFRNAQSMPTSVTDGNGNTTGYSYDPNGNLLTSADALGNTWTYTYNQFNQLLTATPPSGSTKPVTVNTYDSAGNLQTSAQHPSSGSDLTTNYFYVGTPAGLPSSVNDPRGNATIFTYDAYGDLASSTDPAGDKTTSAYTSIGQLFCSTSPKATAASVVCPASPGTRVANTTSRTFDTSNTQVATSTDPNGNTTTYGYDPNGNRTSVQDPLTNSTMTVFDADDRPTSVTAGSGSSAQTVTATAYDVPPAATGGCLSSVATAVSCTVVTQASGTSIASTTSHYNDAFGNPIESVDPGGLVTTATFDQANNAIATTTGAGTTTYGYLANNWLSTETFSGATAGFSTPSSSTSFTYRNDGVRHTMADSSGTTTYTYDAYGRLQKMVSGAGNVVTYKYNADGSPTCVSYPSSGSTTCLNATSGTGIIAYGYDTANQMNSLTDWNANKFTFGYNANSDWSATTYPTTAATTVGNTYGNADNLTKQTVTNVNLSGGSQFNAWTPNGNELFTTTKANSGTANAYGYNSLSQVTSLANSDAYAYDQLGRMTSDTPNGSSAVNSGYTTNSALCWSGTGSPTGATCTSPPSGSTHYTANAINARCYSTTSTTAGTCTAPPTSATTQSYGYSQLGNLTCVTTPNASSYSCASPNAASTSTYAYNGDGLRMSDKPAGGSIQQFTWDVTHSVPNLLADGTNSYLYGPGGVPVEQVVTASSTASYLVSDPTGVRYQFTQAGIVIGSATYGPYGKCTSCTTSTPFGFEDGYKDPNGLIYLVHRFYDPATQQFISVDPLVSQTGQPFSYAAGDPVNNSDPSGLNPWDIFNPWSPNNPLRENAQNGGLPSQLVQTFDPAYLAISGYTNEWQAAENGCGLGTELGYGAEGVLGVAGTLGIAVGGGEVAGFIENPDEFLQIGSRGFHLHFDEDPHGDIGSHLQIDTWLKGISGSGRSWRLPWPPW